MSHTKKKKKNTGVGCHALLQGTFLTQGLNPGLPHCRQILYHLSHQGNPCWTSTVLVLQELTFQEELADAQARPGTLC